ncbi:UNVERIFIED_CONTAM: hypothetical protein Scaly_0063600 [Sesamum calycinum]|uniref:Integrase zinc-binding domain-containing protein n=1 Tax=Sesamum calycinum TaxID=2727403 RepID=A0AAW2SUS8_9LAMI
MGYYWPTIVKDCMSYAQRCQVCQFHANFIHTTKTIAPNTVASWPFDAWGLDMVGPFTKSSVGHLYILAANRLFFQVGRTCAPQEERRRISLTSSASTTSRYGILRYIITNNRKLSAIV